MLSPSVDESLIFQPQLLDSDPLSEPNYQLSETGTSIPDPRKFNLASGLQIRLRGFTISLHPPNGLPSLLGLSPSCHSSAPPNHELILRTVPRAARTRSHRNRACSSECAEPAAHLSCHIESDSVVVSSFCIPEPDDYNFSLYSLAQKVQVLFVSRVYIRLELESEEEGLQLKHAVAAIINTDSDSPPRLSMQRLGLETPVQSQRRGLADRGLDLCEYTPTRQNGETGCLTGSRKQMYVCGADSGKARHASRSPFVTPPKLDFKASSNQHMNWAARQKDGVSPSPFNQSPGGINVYDQTQPTLETSIRQEQGLYGPLLLVPIKKISISKATSNDSRALSSVNTEQSEDVAQICTQTDHYRDGEMVWTHIAGSDNLLLMLAPRPDGLLLQLKFNTKTVLFILAPKEIYECFGAADRIRVRHTEGVFQIKAVPENIREVYRVLGEYGLHPRNLSGFSAMPTTQMPSSAYCAY